MTAPKDPAAKKPTAAERAASSQELADKQREVVNLLHRNQFLLKLMTGVVIVCLAVISVAGIIGARTGADAKEISQQNNRFLENFSNYMRCLIVNEDEVVIAIGEEAYLNICDELLFRGTGQKPHVIKAQIPTTTTTAPPTKD